MSPRRPKQQNLSECAAIPILHDCLARTAKRGLLRYMPKKTQALRPLENDGHTQITISAYERGDDCILICICLFHRSCTIYNMLFPPTITNYLLSCLLLCWGQNHRRILRRLCTEDGSFQRFGAIGRRMFLGSHGSTSFSILHCHNRSLMFAPEPGKV